MQSVTAQTMDNINLLGGAPLAGWRRDSWQRTGSAAAAQRQRSAGSTRRAARQVSVQQVAHPTAPTAHLPSVLIGAYAVAQLLEVCVLVRPRLEHHVLGHSQWADLHSKDDQHLQWDNHGGLRAGEGAKRLPGALPLLPPPSPWHAQLPAQQHTWCRRAASSGTMSGWLAITATATSASGKANECRRVTCSVQKRALH